MSDCVHCHSPLEASQEASGFCCSGCEFVYGLIQDQGLEKFYDLRREESLAPVNDKPFREQDFSWLEPTEENGVCRWSGSLQGVSCIGCVWLVERLFMRREGASRCDVSPAEGAISLEWQSGTMQPEEFALELQQFGYLLGSAKSGNNTRSESRALLGKTSICAAFAMNAMGFSLPRYLGMPSDFMFANIFEMLVMLSATLAMLVGGAWFIRRAFLSLKARVIHMDTPIALGVSIAYIGSVFGWASGHYNLVYFDFVAVFIFLMLGGRWLQTAAMERNRNRLLESTPVPTSVTEEDGETQIPLDQLTQETAYTIASNQTAPVASVVVEGTADFSLEWINGEAEPRNFSEGMVLPAGAIQLSRNRVLLRSQESWQDSLLAKLLREDARSSRSVMLEKILRYYLVIVLLLGIGGGLAWWLSGSEVATAVQVMISVFVISCPCALGVALPLADELASTRMQGLGVFIRSAGFWAKIRQIRTVFFDKTGTLTRDLPRLVNVEALDDLEERDLAMLANLCAGSPHPFSRALMHSLGAAGQKLLDKKITLTEKPGLGVLLVDEQGGNWSLGKCGWNGTDGFSELAEAKGSELRRDGVVLAKFDFEENLRPDARETVAALASLNPHILSGDHVNKVNEIASLLDIPEDQIHAQLDPEKKAALVRRIDAEHAMFLGDGANDALAFEAASVNGAVAGMGLLESKADFYFLSNGLGFLPQMFRLAARHGQAVRAVFSFSLIYNFCAVLVCLSGKMNPLLAAILMPLSSLVSLAIVRVMLVGNNRSREELAIED